MTPINLEDVESYLKEHPPGFFKELDRVAYQIHLTQRFAELRAREQAKAGKG